MKLSIVIPVKNDADGIDACLQSIYSSSIDTLDFEVVVVDNGSTDNSVAVAIRHGATVVRAPDVTVATMRNRGVRKSTGDVIAFIDADCTVASDWFENVARHLDDSSVICFGSPPSIPETPTWVQSSWFQVRKKASADGKAFPIEWLESMNLFVRSDVFRKVGGFDETMITCEDYDLCMRLQPYGTILCDNRIVAIHHGEADTPLRFFQKERWRGSSNFQSFRKHGYALSELPSVLFPLIHVVAAAVALLALLLVMSGVLPFSVWLAGVVIWQLPLFLLGRKKSGLWRNVFGIGVLLNLYFFARGMSLFSGASWGEPQPVVSAR